MTTKQQIESILESGAQVTIADIARLCKCSRQNVHRIMRQEGWSAPVNGSTQPRPASVSTTSPPVVTGGIQSGVSPTVAGTISELLVSADLMARGYKVFMAVVRTSLYDLIAVNPYTGSVLTVEVKTGHRDGNNRLVYKRHSTDKTRHCHATPDYYAIVVAGEPVIFDPNLENAS